MVLISPESRAELDEKLGNACPKVILVAENGFFCKVPRLKGEWEDLIIPGDISWHEAVIGIMQGYHEKTDGTHVYDRDQTITFDYRDADEEFGNWQAKELQ